MADISQIKLPNGDTYNLVDETSGYTSNVGTITKIKTTAGTHNTIDVSSGAATFNVPTKTSHLTNDSGFITDISGKLDSSYSADDKNFTLQYTNSGLEYEVVDSNGDTSTFIFFKDGINFIDYQTIDDYDRIEFGVGFDSYGLLVYESIGDGVEDDTYEYITVDRAVHTLSLRCLTTPIFDDDAATKKYVDDAVNGSSSSGVTKISTTAGAHTTITNATGAVSFNVPTKTSHLTNDSGFITTDTNTTYTLSGALSSHKFTSTLTAGGSGSGTSTSEITFVAGSNVTLTDDTTNKKITIAATDTTYTSKTAVNGGTDVSLVTTGEKYTWNSKTSNTGTVTSVAATGNGGITISGSPITTNGTLTIGLNLSTAINGLSEGTSPAQLDDYAVVQWAGGGTTTTTYHRRKLTNLIVGKAVADQNGLTIHTGYLKLTGGQVTGPTTFGDSVSIDDLTVGQLVVSGNASFANNLQVNTINGVAVGSSPKFTDNNTTYSAGTGLSLSSTTFNHSNSVTAQTTQAVYPIKIDAQGHISAYGSAQTILSIGTGASNAAAGNHSHSYLPLSGGTLTGNLTVGTTSQSAAPTGSIHVHDVRSYVIPTTMFSKGANFFFSNNTMPNSNWWSGIHINGWEGDYNAWELVGTSHNADNRTVPLYVRSGRTTNGWGSWRKIYDTSNKPSASDVGALPIGGGTLTGRLTTADPINQIITGSGTAASDKGSGVSPRYFPAKWTFNTGQTATNGDIITIKLPVAGHTYGVFLSINNGTNYHPVVVGNGTSRLTTHYGNGTPIQLIFDSSGSAADMYALNGADARATVTGGVWRVLNYYADGNTYTTALSTTAAATAAKTASMSYYVATANRYVIVNMAYANTSATALTLNINGTGAKAIYINGGASSTSNYTLPAGSYLVFYDGTNYYFRTDGYTTARHYNEAPASEVTRYPLTTSVTGVGMSDIINTNTRLWIKNGTTSAVGYNYLGLGNATASGTANNSQGYMRTYGPNTGYGQITYANSTANTTHTLPATGGTLLNSGTIASTLLSMVYPVGSIYMSVNSTSPATFLGGTWVQLKDRFLLGAGDTYANGGTGGAATVTLTSAQSGVPAHAHGNTFALSNNTDVVYSTDAVGAARGSLSGSSGNYSYIRKDYNASGTAGKRNVTLSGGVSNNTAANASSAHNNMPPYLVVYMWKRTA